MATPKKAPAKKTAKPSPASSQPKEDLNFIREDDFKTLEVLIDFENVTTNTRLNSVDKAIFCELSGDGFVLELPEKACSKGHNVLLNVETRNAAPGKNKKSGDVKFSVTGKVSSAEKVDAGKLRTEVKLVQFEESDWKAFTEIFAKRQEEILEFFTNIRGY